MSEEVDALLEAYELGHLSETFKAQRMTKAAILALQESDIKELCEFLGDRVVLRRLIAENATPPTPAVHTTSPLIATVVCDASVASTSGVQGTTNADATAECSRAGSSGSIASTSRVQVSLDSLRAPKRPALTPHCASAAKKTSRLDYMKAVEDLDLRALILKDVKGGPEILQFFTEAWKEYKSKLDAGDEEADEPLLDESQRNRITQIIGSFLLELDDNPDHHAFPKLTKKIKDIFPNEVAGAYYIAPYEGSKGNTHATGKIPSAIKNIKRKRKLMGAVPGRSKNTKKSSNPTRANFDVLNQPETAEVKGAVAWLAHGRSPWPTVLQKWQIAAPTRFRMIFKTEHKFANDYIEAFPVLGHNSGYELLLQDFELMYPTAKSLFQKWDCFVKKTLSFAKRQIKEKSCKAILKLCDRPQIERDNVAGVILHILPALKSHHQAQVNGASVKMSIDQARDSYLVTVHTVNDIKRAVTERREKLKSEDGGGQPLIVLVGSSPDAIESAHVSVATLRFDCDSVVHAIDVFFKSCQALHVCYPPESEHIWTVLQVGVYEIETTYDSTENLETWINMYKS